MGYRTNIVTGGCRLMQHDSITEILFRTFLRYIRGALRNNLFTNLRYFYFYFLIFKDFIVQKGVRLLMQTKRECR